MTNRYFKHVELMALFDRNILPRDMDLGYIVGVSDVCSYSLLVEKKKIENADQSVLLKGHSYILGAIDEGKIWILGLSAENISRLLLDHDFFEKFCDKRANPFDLSKRISLYYDNIYAYWTEDVYLEVFGDD